MLQKLKFISGVLFLLGFNNYGLKMEDQMITIEKKNSKGSNNILYTFLLLIVLPIKNFYDNQMNELQTMNSKNTSNLNPLSEPMDLNVLDGQPLTENNGSQQLIEDDQNLIENAKKLSQEISSEIKIEQNDDILPQVEETIRSKQVFSNTRISFTIDTKNKTLEILIQKESNKYHAIEHPLHNDLVNNFKANINFSFEIEGNNFKNQEIKYLHNNKLSNNNDLFIHCFVYKNSEQVNHEEIAKEKFADITDESLRKLNINWYLDEHSEAPSKAVTLKENFKNIEELMNVLLIQLLPSLIIVEEEAAKKESSQSIYNKWSNKEITFDQFYEKSQPKRHEVEEDIVVSIDNLSKKILEIINNKIPK